MRIAIVTDAWSPQVNGVVRTLTAVRAELQAMGHEVRIISPDLFASVPCPTYPEIRLAFARKATVGAMLAEFGADAIHLATEGPLCLAARAWCLARARPFTTAYHTQFPDYVAARTGIPAEWVWRYIRWFHAPAAAILASTPSIRATLQSHGLPHVRHWGRGVDLSAFHPGVAPLAALGHLPRPIQLYVGRVAVEKNVGRSSRTTIPVPRSSSATAPRAPNCRRRTRVRSSWGRGSAPSWPGPMPPPTCSSSPAAPIRSGW